MSEKSLKEIAEALDDELEEKIDLHTFVALINEQCYIRLHWQQFWEWIRTEFWKGSDEPT